MAESRYRIEACKLEPCPEAIDIPLNQVRYGWPGRETAGIKRERLRRLNRWSLQFLPFGVPMWPVCESDASEGDSLWSSTVIGSHSFFRVPEQDRDRHGFLTEDFWWVLWGCLTSSAGGWHARVFTPGTVEVGRSSVWVETLDWVDTVIRGGVDVLLRFGKAVVRVVASIPCRRRRADECDWVPFLGLFSMNFFRTSRKERPSLTRRSWMAFSSRKTGHLLSPDACAPEQFAQWVG
jgi:hypothetical protein